MKSFVVFAAVLAVSAAQFQYSTPQPGRYNPARYDPSPYNLGQYQQNRVQPTRIPLPVVSPSLPPVAAPLPPRPSAVPLVNRGSEAAASILSYENDISPDGAFRYTFQTDNGIAAEAVGTPRDYAGNPPVRPDVIQGNYAYTSPEGQVVAITYIADENGYQAQGDAIPTPHPIPEYILRALDYIAKNGSPQQQKK